MRPLIYQKLFLNSSTKTIVIFATVLLWLIVTVAFSAAVFRFESQKIADQKVLRHKSIEETLIRVFEGYAKFGDLINSKGTVVEIGKPFGVTKFEICKDGLSVPPKPFNDPCVGLKNGYALSLNQESYELFFHWDERSDSELARVSHLLVLTGLISLILVTLVIIVFLRIFKKRLFYIANQISSVDSVEDIEHFKLDVPELKPIVSSIRNLFEIVNKYSKEIYRLKIEEFKIEIARQVAHDIRSPLSALQIAVSKLPNEGIEYILISSASQRIRAIADDLLKKPIQAEIANVADDILSVPLVENVELVNIQSVIEDIIREKRLSFNGKLDLDIGDGSELVTSGSKTETERIISNLLNNSIEALNDSVDPQITVFLRSYGSSINITIADNGRGIPSEILENLGKKGATFGKEGGSGLGIYGAKKYIEKMGGKLEIKSRLGDGTMVMIILPRSV